MDLAIIFAEKLMKFCSEAGYIYKTKVEKL